MRISLKKTITRSNVIRIDFTVNAVRGVASFSKVRGMGVCREELQNRTYFVLNFLSSFAARPARVTLVYDMPALPSCICE